jgi:D-lactate dehydrogenase
MKIFYFQAEEWEKGYVGERLPGHSITFFNDRLEDQQNLSDSEVELISVFVNCHIGPTEMDRFPKLKYIVTRSTGFDHVDMVEAKKRNIVVSNVPSYGENTVAEFAFALLLTISRRIYSSFKRIVETGSFVSDGLRGFDLKGKTIGIIGTGKIGKHMIRMSKGFDMSVVAYDAFPDEKAAADLGFTYMSLDDLLAHSDIISMHAPYLPTTHHLINLDNVGKIKRGAILINTARGGLIDTSAIVKALKDGTLSGAGLDVLEEEGCLIDEDILLMCPHPNIDSLKTTLENHYLMEHPNVVVTPHNAFNTKEAIERIVSTSIENITGFAAGSPKNVVVAK